MNNIPDVVIYVLAIAGIAWFALSFMVLVAVLDAAREALPYFQRMNDEMAEDDTEEDV